MSKINEKYQDGTYLKNNSTWHVEDSSWKAVEIEKAFARNNIQPSTVSEVGCGAGEILKQLSLKRVSTNFSGFELSKDAFNLCQQRKSNNLVFYNQGIDQNQDFFDALLCIDVFEHVEDYLGFLKMIKDKAKYKIFHIPLDINVISILMGGLVSTRRKYGHLHYFTADLAKEVLENSGYEIVDSFYTTAFKDLPAKTTKSKFVRIPRKIWFSLSPDSMVKWLGGCSLMLVTQ